MPDAAFAAIAHFVSRMALGDPFVTEIPGIGILWLGQFSHNALLFFRSLFYSLIEFIPGRVLHVLSLWRKYTGSMFLLRGSGLCLEHRAHFLTLAGRQRIGGVLCRSPDADEKEEEGQEENQAEWDGPVCVHSM
jgi:hypothetical protein